jgi:hypothetical protein
MLEAIWAGEQDPEKLAEISNGIAVDNVRCQAASSGAASLSLGRRLDHP